ncbi:MAG: NUDIX hydrolase, partial [Pseudomonadales bacterium]|nr:NUDIX hydrolase [Pseudomonadales bacterium]
GDIDRTPEAVEPAIPAATVVLLRDGQDGTEVLMLHRTSKVHFGGMWVFPGGRIDPDDYPPDEDLYIAARNAAARETMEETGMAVTPDEFVCFAHWTPPASTPRRYATWFFATALAEEQDVNVDGHEIQDHQWIHPGEMLRRHAAGEVDLAPPTWITLNHLAMYAPVDALLERLRAMPHKIYETRIGRRADGVRVTMWDGDAGYETGNPETPGERHRLILTDGGFVFENSGQEY